MEARIQLAVRDDDIKVCHLHLQTPAFGTMPGVFPLYHDIARRP